ncbi:coiled-coil domain containing 33 isoform X3 [Rhinoraja longicauda]
MAAYYRPHTANLLKERVNLPPYDALAQVLPEYDYLFHATSPKENPKMGKRGRRSPFTAPEPLQTQDPILLSPKREVATEDNVGNQEVIHHEGQELDNYRAAMQKMAADIIKLRQDTGRLETENSKLRSELNLHQNLGQSLLDDTDIDVMTKAEIADRIVLLKHKLASETAEHIKSKDKLQQQQNELIRVIEKMENILNTKLNERPREKADASKKRTGAAEESVRREVEAVLLAENARLRGELGQLRLQPTPIILQQPTYPGKESLADSERLRLLAQVEKAQGRIQTLETLLDENSRKWGREKQSMLTRLSETQHGFTRTSTMLFHDFPLKTALDSHLTRN